MANDIVGVIETMYGEATEDGAWLQRVLETARPSLDAGCGVMGAGYRVHDGDELEFTTPVVSLDVPEVIVKWMNPKSLPGGEFVRRFYPPGPMCAAASTCSGLSPEEWRRWSHAERVRRATGMQDAIGVLSGGSEGCVLAAPKMDVGPIGRHFASTWTRIAAHLSAAHRLRRKLPLVPSSEAVLTPSGRIEHAEGDARDGAARTALTHAAKSIDRARGPLRRRNPEEAVDLWRALVAGRWSLVDHFDHDGQRFLVARRNPPEERRTSALSPSEHRVLALAAMGHSNKFIAYELGVSPSAVAMSLARLRRKLGARTRLELIEAFRRADGEAPPSEPGHRQSSSK